MQWCIDSEVLRPPNTLSIDDEKPTESRQRDVSQRNRRRPDSGHYRAGGLSRQRRRIGDRTAGDTPHGPAGRHRDLQSCVVTVEGVRLKPGDGSDADEEPEDGDGSDPSDTEAGETDADQGGDDENGFERTVEWTGETFPGI